MSNENQKLHNVLFKAYYDPNSTVAFSSCDRLFNFMKKNGIQGSKSDVIDWLQNQQTYTLHKERRVKFNRNHYNITNIDDLWEMDLIDMQKFSRNNNGHKYILAVIDCFSKYAWCIPIKRKVPDEIIRGFNVIFSSTKRKPIKIQSDKGREFVNNKVKTYFMQNGINFFTTRDPATKAAICERFIRTIKGIIYKYFTYTSAKLYIDVLDSLVFLYNNRFHSSIGTKPADVNEHNILNVWNYVRKKREKAGTRKCAKLHVGDKVRISNPKVTFEKGYNPKWSLEKFVVDKVHLRVPVVYNIKDETGNIINGNFYEEELQKVA